MSLEIEAEGPGNPIFYSFPWHWLLLQSKKYGKTCHLPGSVFTLKTKWTIQQCSKSCP